MLSRILKKLELAGLVQNYIQSHQGTREYSFYELTKQCIGYLNAIVPVSISLNTNLGNQGEIAHFEITDLDRLESIFKCMQ